MRAARSSQAYVRIVILAALLLLAGDTARGAHKLQQEASAPPGGAALAAQAQILSGKVETNLAAQRAGLSAAADLLERDPTSAIDAAETALRAAGGEAMAVAVSTNTEVLAVAGRDASADWRLAAKAAAASGRSVWVGGVGRSGRLYVAMAAQTSAGRGYVIAAGDPALAAAIAEALSCPD